MGLPGPLAPARPEGARGAPPHGAHPLAGRRRLLPGQREGGAAGRPGLPARPAAAPAVQAPPGRPRLDLGGERQLHRALRDRRGGRAGAHRRRELPGLRPGAGPQPGRPRRRQPAGDHLRAGRGTGAHRDLRGGEGDGGAAGQGRAALLPAPAEVSVREVGIGIAGFGTVGGGVLSILRRHARDIEARIGARIVVRRVAVRDPGKERMIDLDPGLLTTRYQDLLDDPQVAVVVELVGGTGEAYDLVAGALRRGKHVVTANKALLAARGEEIFRLAAERGVDVYYEGAVCGGVPVIRTLREALASDRINALHGIVNGTTNFILTAMADKGEPIEA